MPCCDVTEAPLDEARLGLDAPLRGQKPPFPRSESRHACCATTTKLLIAMLGWFAVWNLTKVPFYFGFKYDDVTYDAEYCNSATAADAPLKECYGFEFQAQLGALTSWRTFKLLASPVNFLAPHALMGCLLEVFFISVSLHP